MDYVWGKWIQYHTCVLDICMALSAPLTAVMSISMQVLRRAVDMHQKELHQLLKGKSLPLKMILETEDFPMVCEGVWER